MVSRNVLISSAFLLFPVLPLCTASGPIDPNCLKVQATILPPLLPDRPNALVDLTLTNGCGKDITALGLEFKTATGLVWRTAIDWLPRLALNPEYKDTNPDILRDKTTIHDQWGSQEETPVPITASVVYIIFLDRRTAGDMKGIQSMMESRKERLADYQERSKFLDSITDFMSAQKSNRGPRPPRKAGTFGPTFADTLFQNFDHLDPSAWAQRVQEYKDQCTRTIPVFQEKSSLATDDQ